MIKKINKINENQNDFNFVSVQNINKEIEQ